MKTYKTISNKFGKVRDSKKSLLDKNLLFEFLNDEQLANRYFSPAAGFNKSVKFLAPLISDADDFDSANLNNLVLALGNQEKNDKYLTFTEPSKSVKYSNTLVFGSDDFNSQNFNHLLLGFVNQKVNDDYLTSLPLSVSNSSNAPVLVGAEASQSNQKLQKNAAVNNKTLENNNDTVISRTISEVSKNPETQLDETKVKDNLTVVFAENLEIDNSSELELLDIYGIVDTALQDTYNYLGKFRFDSEYSQKLKTAFGTGFNQKVADNLFDKFADGNFTDIPTIKVVNRSAIYGGNGAFSADTGLVYLATEFLAENSQNTARVTDVLIEEIGHFVDSEINEFDSPGDEGDIFSELVQGNTLSDEELQALRAENDTVTVVRNGEEVTTIPNKSNITIENNNTLRVGTWNVYHGNSQTGNITIPEHLKRINYISKYGIKNNIDLIVLQEVKNSTQQPLLDDLLKFKNGQNPQKYDTQGLSKLTAGYSYEIVSKEYPSSNLTPNKQTTDGYLILYNPSTINQISNPQHYQPNAFTKNGTQYRPPIYFTVNKNGSKYNILTWHNETETSGAKTTLPQLTNVLSNTNQQFILLGDLNVKPNFLNQPNILPQQAGRHNNLSYITTDNGAVVDLLPNPNDQTKLKSDSHFALFAEIQSATSSAQSFTNTKVRSKARLNAGPNRSHNPYNYNNITYEYSGNQAVPSWENQLIQIGKNERFFTPLKTVDGGKVTVRKETVDGKTKEFVYIEKNSSGISPNVYSAIGNKTSSALFKGDVKFDTETLKGTITENGDSDDSDDSGFKLLGGIEVFFEGLSFDEDESGSPQLRLQGSMLLPGELVGGNGLEVAINGEDYIGFSDNGVSITGGSVKLPGENTLNILGLLEIKANDAEVQFDFDNQEATLQGTFSIPSLKDATFELNGGNYIKIKKTDAGLDFSMVADINASNIPLFGEWEIENINLNINTPNDSFVVNALLKTPGTPIELELAFNEGKLTQITGSSGVGTDFNFLGAAIDIQTVNVIVDRNTGDNEPWDPEFSLQGEIEIPQLKGLKGSLTGNNKLIVTKDGVELTGAKLSLDEIKFGNWRLRDIEVEYNAQQGIFAGGATLSDSTGIEIGVFLEFDKDGLKRIAANASDLKLLDFTVSDVEVDFTIDKNREDNQPWDPEFVLGGKITNNKVSAGWKIKEAAFKIDTTNNQTKIFAAGTIEIPSGVEVDATVYWNGNELESIEIDVEDLNKPIGKPIAFLQSMSGSYQGSTTEFSGSVGITLGPQIDLQQIRIPFVDIPQEKVSLLRLDLTATVTPEYFNGKGEVTLLGGLLGSRTGEINLNWKHNSFLAKTELDILWGLIKADASLIGRGRGESQFDIYAFAEGSINVPNIIPVIGGFKLGSGGAYFQFIDDGDMSNDYVAAWGQFLFWDVAFKFGFDGSINLINPQISQFARDNIADLEHNINNSYNTPADLQISPEGTIEGKGTPGDDFLKGQDDDNTLDGGDGNDVLSDRAGNNLFSGGAGNDILIGGWGNDTYVFDTDDAQGADTINETMIAVKTFHNTYVKASRPDTGNWHLAQNSFIGDWEKFTVVNNGDGTISLRTFHEHHFWKADNIGRDVFGYWNVQQNSYIGDWEKFRVESHSDGRISFKTFHGNFAHYVRAYDGNGNGIDQVRDLGNWQKFWVENQDNNSKDTLDFSETTTKTINLDLSNPGQQQINENLALTLGITIGSQTFINIENAAGGSLNDTLRGNHLDNRLLGKNGNDWLSGEDGRDTLIGGAGDDYYLGGGAGNDYLDGEQGNDWLSGEEGQDTLKGGAGDDHLYGGDETPNGDSANDTLLGGTGNDYLNGEQGNDWLSGEEGQDTLIGGTGDDHLYGGDETPNGDSANDELWGGTGNDYLGGEQGNDYLDGEQGNDWLSGEEGQDTLKGGAGDDHLYGGDETPNGDSANDTLLGGTGNDYLNGEQGNDWLSGEEGQDTLIGGTGDDHLYGGDETPNGDSANDELWGGTGNDYLGGEQGNDYLDGEQGNDWLSGEEGQDTLKGGAGDDHLYGGDETPNGDSANDELWGGTGNDYLNGEQGNDWLSGEEGQDTLKGGAGDDHLYGGDETPNGDSANDELWGGTGNDYLGGEQGNDWLSGEEGQDTLKGGAGDDHLYGGDETPNGDSANDELWGGTGNDYLNGEQGNDWLSGEEGQDTLKGGDGDDTVYGGLEENPIGDSANDQLWGGAGNDYLDGEQGNDWLSGEEGQDTLKGGDGDDTVYGGLEENPIGDSANDQLWGGTGNDYLGGEQGNDFLRGEQGNDTLTGGTGADVFAFEVNEGIDIIEDFSASDGDKIQIGTSFNTIDKSQFSYDSTTGDLKYFHTHFATLNTDSGFDVNQLTFA
ncbi:Ca2+-binding protein, RTX toxin [Rivularia sp. PCC 7116]|uniref:hypothetical protein n=1 Tax=Rivularia sp. PCC 7116 TaxID=373994 RepID=UPI00029EDA46|nr:hypothetical protein [Rivularia sp. PCC 7116]AFY58915.1 Ca2+-binding protein, RTX toxin [Rivularia sp. PCC 7116]